MKESEKKKNQQINKNKLILGPCLITEKAVEHERDSDTNFSWFTWNSPENFGKRYGRNKKSEIESGPSRLVHC